MDKLFIQVLNLSIAGSWMILAVLLLRLVLKRAPKATVCALWLLVGLRLLLPFSIESALSLIPSRETVSVSIVEPGTLPPVSIGGSSQTYIAGDGGYTGPAQVEVIDSGLPALDRALNPVINESFAPEMGASVDPLQLLTAASGWIWLLGCLGLLAYGAFSFLRLKLRLRESVLAGPGVREGSMVDSPFVLGIFRPVIYLPLGLSERDREMVLAHERAHLKRRDNWIKPLAFMLLAVHWFNPLMWISYVLLCRDIESACDERVLRDMGREERRAYSAALLNCSVRLRLISACPLAFGELSVKGRIKSVLNYRKPGFWISLAALAACAVVALCFLTDPVEAQDGTEAEGTFDPAGEWISPMSGEQLSLNPDGTGEDGSDSFEYSLEGSVLSLDYGFKTVDLVRSSYDGVEHLVMGDRVLDYVRAEDCAISLVDIDLDNWQEYFQLAKRPVYVWDAGKARDMSYSIVLLPREEYVRRISPIAQDVPPLEIGVYFARAGSQKAELDYGTMELNPLGSTDYDSTYYPQGSSSQSWTKQVAEMVEEVYSDHAPGCVLSRMSLSENIYEDYWSVDILDEPQVERFSGKLPLYDKPLLPEPPDQGFTVPLDTPVTELFTYEEARHETAAAVGSCAFIIPKEGEGSDYVPESLTQIREESSELPALYMDSRAVESLERMLLNCRATGHEIEVYRAYESYEEALELYENALEEGSHLTKEELWDFYRSPTKRDLQSGLSVMFSRFPDGEFYTAEEWQDQEVIEARKQEWNETVAWLNEHCAEYGFVQRFPMDKIQISGMGSSLAYRYVGDSVAAYMKGSGLCLEEYLGAADTAVSAAQQDRPKAEVLGAYELSGEYLCYVNISPVEPEYLRPEYNYFNVMGERTLGENSLSYIRAATYMDGYPVTVYDEQSKTLTLCFKEFMDEMGDEWPVEVDIKMTLDGELLPGPGKLLLPEPKETESLSLSLPQPVEYSLEGMDNPLCLLGVELKPYALAGLMSWADYERFIEDVENWDDLDEAEKEWSSRMNPLFAQTARQAMDSITVYLDDGSSIDIVTMLGPGEEDGKLLNWTYQFPQPIDFDSIAAVSLGGQTVRLK